MRRAGKGYVLSMHFAEGTAYDASARETVLLEAATSMSRFDAAAAVSTGAGQMVQRAAGSSPAEEKSNMSRGGTFPLSLRV